MQNNFNPGSFGNSGYGFAQNQPQNYYQNQSFTQPVQQPMMPPIQQEYFIGVNGEEAAKNYPIAPGSSVWLIDTSNRVTYLKIRDFQGVAQETKIYDLVERVPQEQPDTPDINQALYDEIQALKDEIAQIKPIIDELS